jgi:Na+-transporting NADH:ubiquinone oxidoreductase subunit NqrA
MKLRGGYNIRLAGRPAGQICALSVPDVLLLPQRTRRLRFNKLLVKNGQSVRCGHVLAVASGQFDLPLLAPMDGVVRLRVHRGHVQLESLSPGSNRKPPLLGTVPTKPSGNR